MPAPGPGWTFNWTAGYEHPIGRSIYVFTDWYRRSKVKFFLYDSVEFSDDHLMEGGLRIGYKTDRYDIAAFVRNITNDESAVSGIDFNNRPRWSTSCASSASRIGEDLEMLGHWSGDHAAVGFNAPPALDIVPGEWRLSRRNASAT